MVARRVVPVDWPNAAALPHVMLLVRFQTIHTAKEMLIPMKSPPHVPATLHNLHFVAAIPTRVEHCTTTNDARAARSKTRS